MATFITVARTDELPPGQGKLVEVNQKRIALSAWMDATMPSMTCVRIGAGLYPKGSLRGRRWSVPGMARYSIWRQGTSPDLP